VRYAPPELMSGQCYQADEAFDVWSIGILLFKMVYGKFPFEGYTFNDIKSSIISERLKIPFYNEFNGVSDTC
jgi:MAP/microtubule affinity-regulating kinase